MSSKFFFDRKNLPKDAKIQFLPDEKNEGYQWRNLYHVAIPDNLVDTLLDVRWPNGQSLPLTQQFPNAYPDHIDDGRTKPEVRLKPEVQEWCNANMTPNMMINVGRTFVDLNWHAVDQTWRAAVRFYHQNDAIHFKLRWF